MYNKYVYMLGRASHEITKLHKYYGGFEWRVPNKFVLKDTWFDPV